MTFCSRIYHAPRIDPTSPLNSVRQCKNPWPVSSDHCSQHKTSLALFRAHSRVENILVAEAGTAGLNGLNLSLRPWQTVEAGRQFSTIEELTLLGLNRTQRSTWDTADGALAERGTSKRTVLLGLDAVGSERVGQNTGGRSGVSTRAVVYRLC